MKNKVGDLYRLDFPNGKSYIGASIFGSRRRYREHELAVSNGSNAPVHRAWREFGPPVLIVIKKDVPIDRLWSAEKKAILRYSTKMPFGYNWRPGSDHAPGGLGNKHKDESKAKMSKSHLGKKASNETKIRMSKAGLGKKKSDETKEKMRQAKLGLIRSKEHCERLSQSNLGKKRTEEQKENYRQAALRRWQRTRALREADLRHG